MKKTDILVEKMIINDYNLGFTAISLSKKYSLGNATIHRILKRNNIKIRGISEAQRNKEICHHFFNTYTNSSCYWAGFIAADGCLFHKYRSYIILISLKHTDSKHLKKFANEIGYNKEIKFGQCDTGFNSDKYSRIAFASKEMFLNIKDNFSITENKSLTLKPPINMPEEFIQDFIRGYFDGDGCICNGKTKRISFIGTFDMLSWIKLKLENNLIIGNPTIFLDKRTKTPVYTLGYQGKNQCNKIVDWLYKNSTENLRLDRKFEISVKYL